MSFNIPSYPDVPIALGVPSVLRIRQAVAGSLVNSLQNVGIGAAQGAVGVSPDAIGDGFDLSNGAVSNVQNIGSVDSPDLVTGAFGEAPTELTSDDPGVANVVASGAGQWGIFDSENVPVLVPDSFKELDFRQGWRIANYPMEEGAFQSYNKVELPFEVRIALTQGGSDEARQTFLKEMDDISASTELYSVVTPEFTYTNVNIEGNGYRRTAVNGAKLLTVEISLLEIRVAPDSQFTNTATVSGAGTVNGGTVQAVAATPTQQSAAARVQ